MNAVTALPITLAREIRAEHDAALTDAQSALDHARRCGELLIEAKGHVGHGQWLTWLAAHVPELSGRTVRAYMRVAEHPEIEAPSIDAALQRLAAPRQIGRPLPISAGTPAPTARATPSPAPTPNRTDATSTAASAAAVVDDTPADALTPEELSAEIEREEREYQESIDRALSSDDRLAALAAENKRLAGLYAAVCTRRDGLMRESADAVRLLRAERSKTERQSQLIDRLRADLATAQVEIERLRAAQPDADELERLRDENEALRERTAIMAESAP